MDIVQSINDFFEMLESYIDLLIGYLDDSELIDMLLYLFRCIPDEIKGILIVVLVFILLLGIRGALKK